MSSLTEDLSIYRHTVDGKKRIVQQFLIEGLSIRNFCSKYNIPPATLSRWKKQCFTANNGGAETLHARAGRPSKIDAEGQQAVIQKLNQSIEFNKNLKKRDLRAFCEEAAILTAKRRNVGRDVVELSAKTVKKYVLKAAQTLLQETHSSQVDNNLCSFSPTLSIADSIGSIDEPAIFLSCNIDSIDHIDW
jgi:transposase